MAGKVIIVESPAKSKTIKQYVGGDFEVLASMGHVRDLPGKELGVDLENDFAPRYQPIADRLPVLKALGKAVRKAKEVYLASDPDREGEAIAWHLAEALGIRDPRRVEFNEITRSAVQSAMAHPRTIDPRRVNAQQARRVLDRLVGYQLSPLLSRKLYKKSLSAGRVQSVAVKLICDREREIQGFVPQEYWQIFANFTPQDRESPFRARLIERDGKELEKLEIASEQQARAVVAEAESQTYRVVSARKTQQKRSGPPPFITSTLQQDASRRLGFSARKTMRVAQQLYEGLPVADEGSVGLITYMRTDSTRVAQEAQQEARRVILERFGEAYLPTVVRQRKAPPRAQEAHEAIRPTSCARHPDSLVAYLDRDQFRLYRLIWSRFLASQMAAAVYDVTTVDVRGGPFLFRARHAKLGFPGWQAVYQQEKEEEDEEKTPPLPELREGEPLRLISLEPEQHFTEPPPFYTEATLVRALEAEGIGRPSTYAPILATIVDRGYVYLDARRLRPTDLGFMVTDQLVEHFPEVMQVKFTARMEDGLDQVEEGKQDWVALLREFYQPFSLALERAEAEKWTVRSPARQTGETCPECGQPLVERSGRQGRFLGCSGYPACKFTRPLGGEAQPDGPEAPKVSCPVCGRPMTLRRSRYGPFLGCSGYPECKQTLKLTKDGRVLPRRSADPTGETCPKCGKPMVIKQTRRGRFLACTGFPSCRSTRPLASETKQV